VFIEKYGFCLEQLGENYYKKSGKIEFLFRKVEGKVSVRKILKNEIQF